MTLNHSEQAAVITKSFDLGAGHYDILRLVRLGLPKGASFDHHKNEKGQIVITASWPEDDKDAKLQILLEPETSRTIALITLPVTKAQFSFYGLSKAKADLRFDRLMLALQRGGG